MIGGRGGEFERTISRASEKGTIGKGDVLDRRATRERQWWMNHENARWRTFLLQRANYLAGRERLSGREGRSLGSLHESEEMAMASGKYAGD